MPLSLDRVQETVQAVVSLLLCKRESDPDRLYTWLSWLLANKCEEYPELTTGSGRVCLDLFTTAHAVLSFVNSYYCPPSSGATAAIGLSRRILSTLAMNQAATRFLSEEGIRNVKSDGKHHYTLLLHSRALNREIQTRARTGPKQSLRYLAAPADDSECADR